MLKHSVLLQSELFGAQELLLYFYLGKKQVKIERGHFLRSALRLKMLGTAGIEEHGLMNLKKLFKNQKVGYLNYYCYGWCSATYQLVICLSFLRQKQTELGHIFARTGLRAVFVQLHLYLFRN